MWLGLVKGRGEKRSGGSREILRRRVMVDLGRKQC
ncbi:unnamed protein product [Brassica oleracea]